MASAVRTENLDDYKAPYLARSAANPLDTRASLLRRCAYGGGSFKMGRQEWAHLRYLYISAVMFSIGHIHKGWFLQAPH